MASTISHIGDVSELNLLRFALIRLEFQKVWTSWDTLAILRYGLAWRMIVTSLNLQFNLHLEGPVFLDNFLFLIVFRQDSEVDMILPLAVDFQIIPAVTFPCESVLLQNAL